jgi:tetratricopeptide (TPR) repeat protein
MMVSIITQGQVLTPPAGGNKKAAVMERIGITDVQINYDRPAVKGREGKIWGNVVHYGFANLDYGTSKAAPWRAGANENTTIEFSTEVNIEGKPLPAGKYGFFIAMGPEKATLIFSKYNTAWGSFYYDPKDDALRVDVPVLKLNESVERLKYEFSDEADESAVVSLQWEKIKIPFTISVDLQKTQIAEYRKEFNSGGFYRYWQNMQSAANYCLINNINLEEGLSWAERSVNTYFGEANFLTLSTYAGLLEKMGRQHESDSLMKKALPMATLLQLNSYGRTLLKMKKNTQAFDIYKMNYEKYPKDVYTNIGMIKGYAAVGNKNEAIKFADNAILLVTDQNSKAYIEEIKQAIELGKDITNY